VTTD